jgi:hypothetical protein
MTEQQLVLPLLALLLRHHSLPPYQKEQQRLECAECYACWQVQLPPLAPLAGLGALEDQLPQ